MSKILLFIACLMVTGTILAQKVSKDEAMEAASSYLGIKATRGGGDVLKLAHTQLALDGTKNEDIFVFNNVRDGGFVMVAGDFRASSLIIGYSDEGSFEADKMPENMKWWFSELARQIDFLRDNKAEVQQRRVKVEVKAKTPEVIVAPLLETVWNQRTPFNKLVPTGCPTGCVATAMAQIMYYHKWPLRGNGSHTNANDPTLTVDFSKSTYQWNKMLASYNSSYTDEQADAVAKLMYDCGISVDMIYATDGSGAVTLYAANAFKTYFDYAESATFKWRSETDNWDNLMIEELQNKRPILYSGSTTSGAGHAFVCDGYKTDGGNVMFHINWGWGGYGNCYTLSSVMADESDSKQYSENQGMIIGIKANNKQSSEDLYYSITGESTAIVTYPNDISEYIGDIVIPSQVIISSKTYDVTGINANAFAGCTGVTSVTIPASVTSIGSNAFNGCTGLKTIYVNWTSDIPAQSLSIFDFNVYSSAKLVVPNGAVATYSELLPWKLFSTIKDNNGASVEYTAWKPFRSGAGQYTRNNSNFGVSSSHLEIVSRTSKVDENKSEVMIKNWIGETPMFFEYDNETNKCHVPIQGTGETRGGSEVIMSDMPTFNSYYTYSSYPCTYNPQTGLFSLFVIYHIGNISYGHGDDTFQLDGTFVDTSVEITSVGEIIETGSGTATQSFGLSSAAAVSSYKYAIVKGTLDIKEAAQLAQQIADGTVDYEETSESSATVTYTNPGKYTFIVISLDSEGKYRNGFAYKNVSWLDEIWEEVTKGSYTYTLLASGTANNLSLSQSKADPTKWKISNAFNNVDFYFTWNTETDIITFDNQNTGWKNQGYDVLVKNYNNFFSYNSDNESKYDRNSDTFKFYNVYGHADYYYTGCVGIETFVVPGLTELLTSCTLAAVDRKGNNIQQGVLSGSYVDIHDSFKSISITGQKSNVNIYYTREFSNANVWQSWFVPFDVSYYDLEDDYEVGKILGMTESAIIYKEVTSGTVYANTPYIVKPKKAGLITTTTTSTLRATSASPISGNVAGKGDYEIGGVYAQTVNNSNGWYAINKSGNFQKMGSSVYLRPFRIYMTADWIDGSSSMDMIDISDVTGIEDQLTNKSKASGTRYNLAGQAVGEGYKGIVIKNGKKHLAR